MNRTSYELREQVRQGPTDIGPLFGLLRWGWYAALGWAVWAVLV